MLWKNDNIIDLKFSCYTTDISRKFSTTTLELIMALAKMVDLLHDDNAWDLSLVALHNAQIQYICNMRRE
jgi:hypothetical protein